MQAIEELEKALEHLVTAKIEIGEPHWSPPRRKDQAPSSTKVYWASRGTIMAIAMVRYALQHLEQEQKEP